MTLFILVAAGVVAGSISIATSAYLRFVRTRKDLEG